MTRFFPINRIFRDHRLCFVQAAEECDLAKTPRLAPLLAASSTSALLFTAVVNIPHLLNSPSTSHQLHFRSGIECQYLEKQVKFFPKRDVWNSDVAWATLALRYENFLREKKEVNRLVQSQRWSYLKAVKTLDNREKENKRNKQKLRQINCNDYFYCNYYPNM